MPRYFEVITLYCAPDCILADRLDGRDVYDAAPEPVEEMSEVFWAMVFGEMYSRGWIVDPKFIGDSTFNNESYNVKVEGIAKCWIAESQRAAFSADLDAAVSEATKLAQEELDGARKDIAVEQD